MANTKILFFVVLIFASSLAYEIFEEFEDSNSTTSTTGGLTTGSATTGSSTSGSTTDGTSGKLLILQIIYVFTGSTSGSSTTGSTNSSLTCDQRLSCGDCVTDDKCLWCQGSSQCISGNWWGPKNTSQCGDSWRFKQCKTDSKLHFKITLIFSEIRVFGNCWRSWSFDFNMCHHLM
jgi:hypothetical protein